MLEFRSGRVRHRGSGLPAWPGQAGEATKGGTLGLLVDLTDGSLAVYKGGQRLGLALPPGSLVGPLCWAADVYCHNGDVLREDHNGNSVRTSPYHNGVRIVAKPVP